MSRAAGASSPAWTRSSRAWCGATFLKLCATGGVTSLSDSLEDTQLTVEEMRAAVEEAKARHTYVTIHTINNDGILRGLEAGVQCFEHAAALDQELAEKVAAAGDAVYLTETTEGGFRLTASNPEFARKLKAAESLSRRYRHALRELAK